MVTNFCARCRKICKQMTCKAVRRALCGVASKKINLLHTEYQGGAAFRQKSFRKKNTDAIDSCEQADQYIKEHIKNYCVDGKSPNFCLTVRRTEMPLRAVQACGTKNLTAEKKKPSETLIQRFREFAISVQF